MSKRVFAVTVILCLFIGSVFGGGVFAKKKETINLTTAWAFNSEVLQKFEKETGIKVNQDVILNPDNLRQVRNTRIAAGEDLDIITADQNDPGDFAKKGYMVDLSGEPWLKRFQPAMLREMNNVRTLTPGKTYFVSYEGIFMGVWYNKTLFKKYRIKTPTNYSEFITACETLKKNGVAPLVQGAKDLWPLDQELKFSREKLMCDNPTFVTDLFTGKAKWNDKAALNAFKRLEFLKPDKGYYLPGMLGTSYDQCWQLLLQHKAAMWAMGSWATEVMVKSDVKPDFEVGVFPLPLNDKGGQQYSLGYLAGRPFGIYAKSKNIAACKKFLEFMSRPANINIYAAKAQVIPTVIGAKASTVPAGADWMKIAKLPLGGPEDQDYSAGYRIGPEVQKIWWSELVNVVSGKATIEDYCNALQQAQEKDIAALKK